MIKLIVGSTGEGKTQILTKMANEDVKKTRGHLIYIDYRNTRMLQIDYKIRFINVGEYKIKCQKGLYSFICGIIASNYDIETIYIDGLQKIVTEEIEEMEEFFRIIDILELRFNINFVITVNSEKENLPKFLDKYRMIS